jgi:hypothetical protein
MCAGDLQFFWGGGHARTILWVAIVCVLGGGGRAGLGGGVLAQGCWGRCGPLWPRDEADAAAMRTSGRDPLRMLYTVDMVRGNDVSGGGFSLSLWLGWQFLQIGSGKHICPMGQGRVPRSRDG